jgi:hypothetical protein
MAYLMFLAWIMYVYVDFSCGMWERPSGNADCNKCNTADVPCTEYRCQSLGELCKFVNKGTSSELCLAMEANSSLPVIEPLLSVITPGYKYDSISEKGFEIRKENGNCVDPFNTIHMGIKVTPFSKCRFDTDPKKKWEEMTYEFGFKGSHVLPAHQLDLFFPSPEAVKRSFAGEMICNTTENPCKEQFIDGKKQMICPKCNLTQEQIEKLTKTEIFVKCKTADGRQNPDPYSIKTCVNPGPDLTPPVIRIVTPGTGSYAKYGQNNQSIVVYVDEPSQCRWTTKGSSTPFDQMENELDCRINVGNDYKTLVTPGVDNSTVKVEYGLPCFGTLDINKSQTFWIKCQDLSENRNNMTYSFQYDVRKSESPLKIVDMRPLYGSEIISPVDPVSILFRVETTGGAVDGESKCKYYDSRTDLFYYISDTFKENYTNIHEIPWTNAPRGDWNMTFECWDVAGNIDKNNTFFRIIIDDQGPKIVRIFNYGGLKISTSEPADCKYSTKKNFIFENATEMTSANRMEHTGQWSFNIIYYVECRDDYENPGPRMVVSPFEEFSF